MKAQALRLRPFKKKFGNNAVIQNTVLNPAGWFTSLPLRTIKSNSIACVSRENPNRVGSCRIALEITLAQTLGFVHEG